MLSARLLARNAGLVRAGTQLGAAPQAARAFATSETWGDDAWRWEKDAFKKWAHASTIRGSVEERQMYAFLASSFGDCDVDKTGWINEAQFDRLLENVAALPRRFGLAPSWRAEYGTVEKRTEARKVMFDAIDGADGHKPRGKIAMGQFISWAKKHINKKAATLAEIEGDVAIREIEKYSKTEFLAFLDKAVNDPQSGASASFYNYLLVIFIEADTECKGRITFAEFNKLVDIAAKSPRFFGLAPNSRDTKARKEMFDQMDSTHTGYVTFRKFLRFVREHVRGKLSEHAAKNA